MAYNASHHIAEGSGAAQTITTSSFTPQDDSVIYVFCAGYADDHTTAISNAITDSEGLSWTKIAEGEVTSGGGFFDLGWVCWRAVVSGTGQSMTVTCDRYDGSTALGNYGIQVISVTGLESPYDTNEAENQNAAGNVTVTRTAPTGPTIACFFAGGDGVATTWGAEDTDYTALGTSTGTLEVASESWESADSTTTTIDQTWTSSGTEYNTVGFSIELIEATGGASAQEGYRIREDGAEASPTWVAAQDTKATIDKETTYQARVVVEETGNSNDITDGFDWLYKLSTDSEWLAPGVGVGGDITFVGGSYIRDANGPNISTDLSSMDSGTIAADDFALLTVMVDQDDLTAIVQDAGDTFTLLHYDESTAGRDRGSALFYRKLDGTETTVTFSATGDTAEEQSIAVSVWRGVDTTTPFDVTWAAGSHYTEGQNNYLTAPAAITTVTNKAMVVAMQTITHDDITAAGAPSGYDIRIDGTGTTNDFAQQLHVSKVVATAGAETPGVFTHTVNATVAEAQCRTVALRPAAGAPAHLDRAASTNISASGTDVTTSQLTAPAGSVGFDAGRRADDGPTAPHTIDAGGHTEDEVSFQATADATAGATYDIKIVYDDGSDLDAYTVTIQVEIASASGATVNPSAVAATSTIPSPEVSVDATPASIGAVAALGAPTVDISATGSPSVFDAPAALGDLDVAVTAVPSGLAAIAALSTPTSVGQSSATQSPATIDAVTTAPSPAVGVGAAGAAIAVPVGLLTPQEGIGVTPASFAAPVSLLAPSVATGVSPSSFAASTSFSTPDISIGVVLARIQAITALLSPASVGQDSITASPASFAAAVDVLSPDVSIGVAPASVSSVADLSAALVSIGVALSSIDTTVSVPSPASVGQDSITANPAGVSTATSLPATLVSIGVALASIDTALTLPAPASVGQDSKTVNPASISAAAAMPSPVISVGVASSVLALSATVESLLVSIGVAPASIGSITSVSPLASTGQGSVTRSPGVITSTVALLDLDVGIGVAPAGFGLTTSVPAPASAGQGGVTVTPAGIATLTDLLSPDISIGVAPASLAALASILDLDVSIGVVLGSIGATTALGSPATLTGAGASPATIAALSAFAGQDVSIGVAPASFEAGVALPTPSLAAGTTAQPTVFNIITSLLTPQVSIGVAPAVIPVVVAFIPPVNVGDTPTVVIAVGHRAVILRPRHTASLSDERHSVDISSKRHSARIIQL